MVPLNQTQGAARAQDKKYLLMTFPREPPVQIQNNFTVLFLMMASTKSAQTVLLGLIQGPHSPRRVMSLNEIF